MKPQKRNTHTTKNKQTEIRSLEGDKKRAHEQTHKKWETNRGETNKHNTNKKRKTNENNKAAKQRTGIETLLPRKVAKKTNFIKISPFDSAPYNNLERYPLSLVLL